VLAEEGRSTPTKKQNPYFSPELYKFLRQLNKNNERKWFAKNKHRYETVLLQPSLRFIKDAGRQLKAVSPQLVADPKPFRGSLFRIYRDIRFSKDKSPYKTNLAMEFWHRKSKGHSSPGLYLHIQPGENFLGAGVWHPDTVELSKIRMAIANRPDSWKSVLDSRLVIEGDSLKRPPTGFSQDHPFIQDIKRKDFISSVSFLDKQIVSLSFMQDFVEAGKKMNPLNKFLAHAIGLEW
jgi:uncharacterized protein (TIGR02453 family)